RGEREPGGGGVGGGGGPAAGRPAVLPAEELALEVHAVLDRYAAAQRLDSLDAVFADRLGVIEEPAGLGWPSAIGGDLLEHVKVGADRLVVGGVQPERPAVLKQEPGGCLKLGGGVLGQLGARLGEVLVVPGRGDEVLPRAVGAQPFIAVAWA